jgi:hypothetical protein
MSPGFIECLQGSFTHGVDEVEKVGEQVDGACVLIVVVTLLLILEHYLVRGLGAQSIAGIRIEEAVGGDYEIGIVGRKLHGKLLLRELGSRCRSIRPEETLAVEMNHVIGCVGDPDFGFPCNGGAVTSVSF